MTTLCILSVVKILSSATLYVTDLYIS